MKERPILFSGPMVRAILAGKKTQTRRVCQVQPFRDDDGLWHAFYPWGEGGHGIYETEAEMRAEYDRLMLARCPYGRAGDRLWVRETWSPDHRAFYPHFQVVYRADKTVLDHEIERGQIYSSESRAWFSFRWRPSIHMPRAAARLVLPVVSMRLERLQDISEEDSIAEGVPDTRGVWDGVDGDRGGPREAFRVLWDSINGEPRKRTDGSLGPDISWKANPWVWVVTFEVPR